MRIQESFGRVITGQELIWQLVKRADCLSTCSCNYQASSILIVLFLEERCTQGGSRIGARVGNDAQPNLMQIVLLAYLLIIVHSISSWHLEAQISEPTQVPMASIPYMPIFHIRHPMMKMHPFQNMAMPQKNIKN